MGLTAALVTTCVLLLSSWYAGIAGPGTEVELEDVILHLPGAFKAHHYYDNTDLSLRQETRPFLPFIHHEPLIVHVGYSFRHNLKEQSGPTRYCLYREPPDTCLLVIGKKKSLAFTISGHETDVGVLAKELERQLVAQHVVSTEKSQLKEHVYRTPDDSGEGQPSHASPAP